MIEKRLGEMVTYSTRGEANETIDRKKRYEQIIKSLAELKEATAKELAIDMYNKGLIPTTERNFTAPRLTEMSKKGIVEPIGKKRDKYTGKMVAVYKLLNKQLTLF